MRSVIYIVTSVALCANFGCAVKQKPAAGNTELQSYLAHIAAADATLRLNDVAGARRWLDAAPIQYRNWEWRHLNSLTDDSLGAVVKAESGIYDIATSPDGSLLACATSNGEALVVDVKSNAVVARLTGAKGELYRIAFSPDGSKVAAAGSDRVARIWNVQSASIVTEYKGHTTPITGIVFSADGSRVYTSGYTQLKEAPYVDGTIKVWDPSTGNEITEFRGIGKKPISKICLNSRGVRLAVSTWDGILWVLDSVTGKIVGSAELPDEGKYTALNDVAFSPDGWLIAVGSKDGTARIFDAGTVRQRLSLQHDAWVTGVTFSRDGKQLVTVSSDNLLRTWEVSSGKFLNTLRGHLRGPQAVTYSRDGSQIFSGAEEGQVLRWDAQFQDYGSIVRKGSAGCYGAAFSPDSKRFYTCFYDGSAQIIDANSWQSLKTWKAHGDQSVNMLELSGDGERIVTCSWDKTIRVWDANDATLLRTINVESPYFATISHDGQLIASTAPKSKLLIHNADTGELVRELIGHEKGAQCASFSPDGRLIATSAQDKTVRVWRIADGTQLMKLECPGAPHAVTFSPDGKRIAAAVGDRVMMWNASDGALLFSTVVSNSDVFRVRFTPDGTRLAAASTLCHILDTSTGQVVLTLHPPQDGSWNMTFSPDGSQLVTCSTDGSFVVHSTTPAAARIQMKLK